MVKRVVLSGLLGGVVLILWTFVVNGVFGFRSSIDMNTVSRESEVYAMLKETVTEPGRYTVNPKVDPSVGFPAGEPVFSVSYSGLGHEAAGRLALLHLGIAFVVVLLASAMLAATSGSVLSSYPQKVLFFAGLGLFLALFHDLHSYDIGRYPLADALLLAANSVLSWTAVGLVVAPMVKAPVEAT